ncbi:hypothetical protein T09_9308 [Trichinella sp. T9]|nr:hypothetical protein T09_9308 [Trichinella sp. T9]
MISDEENPTEKDRFWDEVIIKWIKTCLPRDVVAQWSGCFFPSPDGSTNPQLPCQLNQLDASFKEQLQLQTQEWYAGQESERMVNPDSLHNKCVNRSKRVEVW